MSHSIPRAWMAWKAIMRSRYATITILLTFPGISAYVGSIEAAQVTASGFMLKVDGKPFVIKGMNYAPVPIGVVPGDPPHGDYFTPNFANVWKPDIDKMREAGINVIKLYAGDPGKNAGQPDSGGNWKAFLDYLWNNGNRPVYVIMFSYTQGGVIANGENPRFPADVKLFGAYMQHYKEMVASTVKHPAVFGYMIGNEIFDATAANAQFWVNFGKLIDAAVKAGTDVGKKPFITTALTDVVGYWPAIELGEQSGQVKNIDAWSINIYRGPELGGSGNSPFTTYAALMKQLGLKKPMILGEWGTPHTTRPAPGKYGQDVREPCINLDDVPPNDIGAGRPYFDAKEVGAFLNGLWDVIKGNVGAKNAQVCVGGFIFEWSDEYYKAGEQFRSKQVGNPNFVGGSFAGSYGDEAGYGVTSDVDASAYGLGRPNITRTLFKGYHEMKKFYNASSHTGGELY
jgi:hypothetical protein